MSCRKEAAGEFKPHCSLAVVLSLLLLVVRKKQELSDKDAQMQQKKNVRMSFVPTAVKLMAICFLFFQ